LKLSNLLQLDRFEEDLAISRVRLYAPSLPPPAPASPSPSPPPPPPPPPAQEELSRQRALLHLRQFKNSLH
jgi:hypothetical protein